MKTTLRKIPVEFLLDALTDIYESGAEFVDIVGITNKTQDTLRIIVRDEYLFEGEPEQQEPVKLNDKNINDIIAWQ